MFIIKVMKQTFKILLLLLSISLINCKKDNKDVLPPDITTLEVTEITTTTAVSGGEVDVYYDELAMGLIINTSQNPTFENYTGSFLPGTIGQKRFSSEMRNLVPNTKYYVRAYVMRNGDVKYGNQVEFTTLAE